MYPSHANIYLPTYNFKWHGSFVELFAKLITLARCQGIVQYFRSQRSAHPTQQCPPRRNSAMSYFTHGGFEPHFTIQRRSLLASRIPRTNNRALKRSRRMYIEYWVSSPYNADPNNLSTYQVIPLSCDIIRRAFILTLFTSPSQTYKYSQLYLGF